MIVREMIFLRYLPDHIFATEKLVHICHKDWVKSPIEKLFPEKYSKSSISTKVKIL